MKITLNGSILPLVTLICLVILCGCEAKRHRSVRQYDARIMDRPDDVPEIKCGEDIKLTCVAEGSPSPEIQWRYYSQETNTDDERSRVMIKNAGRDGRIKIKTEEIYVVRSTLIIRDADPADEGMYQCRASNYVNRNNRGINIHQHWRIEEVPVGKVMCKKEDTILTHTEVYPASAYNRSVFEEAVDRIVTSANTASSTTDLKKLVSLMPSSSTETPLTLQKPRKSHHKSKNDNAKKNSKNMVGKGTKKPMTAIMVEKVQSNEQKETPVKGTGLDQNDDDGSSGLGIHQQPWILMLLQFPLAIALLLTSSW